jgi:hypothetical protein
MGLSPALAGYSSTYKMAIRKEKQTKQAGSNDGD